MYNILRNAKKVELPIHEYYASMEWYTRARKFRNFV